MTNAEIVNISNILAAFETLPYRAPATGEATVHMHITSFVANGLGIFRRAIGISLMSMVRRRVDSVGKHAE